MAGSVQFRGKDDTLEAFENRKVDCWSIWQGKQFLTKGKGVEQLDAFIELLSKGATNAVYTCKVYEDYTEAKQIKSNSPDDGSFNFRLNEPDMEITGNQYGRLNSFYEIKKEMKELKEMVISGAGAQEDTGPNPLGKFGEILEHPTFSPIIAGVMTHFVNKALGTNIPVPEMQEQAISGIPNTDTVEGAVQRLKKLDPKLSEHLNKLATIGEKYKPTFDMFIKSLETWAV